ncbi:MAG: hypothetical protein ABIT04_04865 [Novosphingobium sp.]
MIAALAMPVVIGAAGLAIDVNRGLAQRELGQRAADMAALGAAMAYKASPNSSILTPAAQDIVAANGIAGATVTAALVGNFPTNGAQSVRVTVTTTLPYTLGRILRIPRTYTVAAEAYASLTTQPAYAPPCYLALYTGPQAMMTSGGATISGIGCSAAAVGSIANNGTSITASDIISGGGNISNASGSLSAQSLRFAGTFTNPAWNTSVPPASARVNQATTLVDPWSASTELSQARSQLGAYVVIPALGNPTTPSGSSVKDWSFDYSPVAPVLAFKVSSGNYVVPPGTYNINKLTIAGGVNVTFQNGSNITVAAGFTNSGASVNFGNANISVNGGFDTGSSGVTIGVGTLWIGSGTVSFKGTNVKGDGNVTINSVLTLGGGQKLTMGAGQHYFGGFSLGGGGAVTIGAGPFIASSGVAIGGGSELSIGDGSVLIGIDANANSINLSPGGLFFMGDGVFGANGNIITAGGSRIVFGKTANHQINGNLTIAGSALFGAGRYTIRNNFTNGTGGTTWPYTSSLTGKTYGQTLEGVSVSGYDMAGVNVTFVLVGTVNLSGGAKSKLIAAAASVSGAQIGDMLAHSMGGLGTSWSGGATSVFAGTVYLPNSTVTMSGGNATLGAGQCFTLIAYKILATGGASSGTACPTMTAAYGGGGASTIKLVQ